MDYCVPYQKKATKMLNTTSWDPLHIANYVGEYLDLIESLPFDLQRNVSLMREIDSKYQELLKELDEAYEKHCHEEDPIQQKRLLHCIQRALIRSQELGDEKIQLASQMVEMVENRSRQVDSLAELLETRHEPQESMTATTMSSIFPSKRREEEKRREESLGSIESLSGANKRSRRQKNSNIETQENISTVHHDEETGSIVREKRNKTSKKKKKSKARADREPSPTDLPIDPNEPTYCLCEQVSFGEMIGCDNDECPIEWFHFSCVGLNHKPKGKWYCPKCRGDTEKTMDKALEKAKKERAYNR
ncbi:inhibitor of growth protein 1-like isoform X2 [Onychostoma macrolepis]|uniref:inhibitor of growth protein 1-like isoform X2 n=1 Tax=Onychostoma macrolepis TaxID=369639 RepID=UPI00272A3524|nr:inhibitor of growth protein 1-like isoform X2 [Onychostoma macrolepis]